jgi:hypothetical protein
MARLHAAVEVVQLTSQDPTTTAFSGAFAKPRGAASAVNIQTAFRGFFRMGCGYLVKSNPDGMLPIHNKAPVPGLPELHPVRLPDYMQALHFQLFYSMYFFLEHVFTFTTQRMCIFSFSCSEYQLGGKRCSNSSRASAAL